MDDKSKKQEEIKRLKVTVSSLLAEKKKLSEDLEEEKDNTHRFERIVCKTIYICVHSKTSHTHSHLKHIHNE